MVAVAQVLLSVIMKVLFKKIMKTSAGILLYKINNCAPEIFLVHPGGPFWNNKDKGSWSIPKGEFNITIESPLNAALREFQEEIGHSIPDDLVPLPLPPIKQSSSKMVYAFILNWNTNEILNFKSNNFDVEFPPGSGKIITVPEIDNVGWFNLNNAKFKINKGQSVLLNYIKS